MTLEEAKKILEKEGFKLGGPGKPGKPGVVSEDFTEYESPEICEAMQIVCSAGFQLAMLAGVFDERKERLKKEYEKNTKAPVSGKEQPKEKKGIIYTTTFPKADFYYKHVLDEGNPALKESASQFNDSLLDEQAKKIAELTKEKSNLEDQITVLNACKKHNDKIDRKQIKRLGKEIARLNGIIHDKNAILADVAEELRLTKIREKNLAELGLKYVVENDKLKKELADKVVDKIDAQALKSAESALAWKEKVVTYKDMALAYYEKKIAEKDEEIRALKLQISALEKRGNGIDWKRNADAIKLYVNRASRERLWNPINQEICNEQELSFIINHGGKRVKYALRFDGADIIYECSDPDKKPRIPTPEEPKHGNSREDFIKKTIDNYNRRAANLGCVGSRDGNGISDQMVGVDIAEEGADLSCVIVICGKDFVKKFKENEESLSEFLKNIEDEAVESMSIESGHLGGNESFSQMEAVKPSQRFKQAVCDERLELLYFIS